MEDSHLDAAPTIEQDATPLTQTEGDSVASDPATFHVSAPSDEPVLPSTELDVPATDEPAAARPVPPSQEQPSARADEAPAEAKDVTALESADAADGPALPSDAPERAASATEVGEEHDEAILLPTDVDVILQRAAAEGAAGVEDHGAEPPSEEDATEVDVPDTADSQAETQVDDAPAGVSATGDATPALSHSSPLEPALATPSSATAQLETIDRASAATPPTAGAVTTGKKFASSLSVNKKFMEKAGTDPKASSSSATKSVFTLGRPSTSTTPSAVSPSLNSAAAAGPRLLTGRLSNTSGIPPSGQWAKGGDLKGPFLAFQPARGGGPAGRGRGRGTTRGEVWGRNDAADGAGPGPSMGRLGDFPSVAEAARSKQLKANAIAAAATAKETASKQAAEAASKAAAEYNQHLLENLDAFRGRHLDPNASHWDEMEDEDDIGDFVDFGDGAHYKVESELPPSAEPPPPPADDYDRGHAAPPEKRLFNDRSNKLEPVAQKKELPPAAPQQVLSRKSKAAQQAQEKAAPATKATPASKTAAAGPGPQPVPRVSMIPPAPSKNPWAAKASTPTPSDAPTSPKKAAAPASVSIAEPSTPASPAAPPIATPKSPPQLSGKEFATAQEKEMRDTAERARKRRQEEEAALEAERKAKAAQRLKELDERIAKSSPKPSPAVLAKAEAADVTKPATPPPSTRPQMQSQAGGSRQPPASTSVAPATARSASEDRAELWRNRAEAPSRPVAPEGPKQILARASPPQPAPAVASPSNARPVKLLQKPAPPAASQPATVASTIPANAPIPAKPVDVATDPQLPGAGPPRGRRGSMQADTERFWRRAAPELTARPAGEGPPVGKRTRQQRDQQTKGPSVEREASSERPTLPRVELPKPTPLAVVPPPPMSASSAGPLSAGLTAPTVGPARPASRGVGPSDASFADTMSRIKLAMEKSKKESVEHDHEHEQRAPPLPPPPVPQQAEAGPSRMRQTASNDKSATARPAPLKPAAIVKAVEEPPQTAKLVEMPAPAWKTFPIRLGKINARREPIEERLVTAYWAHTKPDRVFEAVSFAPRSGDWSTYRLDRDRYLFREAKIGRGKAPPMPPKVSFVSTEAALAYFVNGGGARSPSDGFDRSGGQPGRPRGRADAELTWRRSPVVAMTSTPAALADVPELNELAESLLFVDGDEAAADSISVMLPASRDSPNAKRSRFSLRRQSRLAAQSTSIDTEPLDELDKTARVRLPGGAKPKVPIDEPTPVVALAAPKTELPSEPEVPMPVPAPAVEEAKHVLTTPIALPPPTAAQALALAAAATKSKSHMGSMSESLSAAPFLPSTPLRDDGHVKSRSTLLTPTSAWSPAQSGPSASLPIIDPHLKNVWGPSDVMDAQARTQENSLKGIVDDLPTAPAAALNALKALDDSPVTDMAPPLVEKRSTSGPTPSNALQYEPIGSASLERRDSRSSRPSARDALAAVGGLPFGQQQYSEDSMSNTSYGSVPYTSAPPMVSSPVVSSPYPYPYYLAATPSPGMSYSVGSPNPGMSYSVVPVLVNSQSPWSQPSPTGMPSPYPPQQKVYYQSTTADAYPGFPGLMSQPYGNNALSPTPQHVPQSSTSYKVGSMRGTTGRPIGHGRPGGNSGGSSSNGGGPGYHRAYEPFGSPLHPSAPLPLRSPSGPTDPRASLSPVGGGPIALPGGGPYIPGPRGGSGNNANSYGFPGQPSNYAPPSGRWS